MVCDISQQQLDKCPSSYPHKFCFDICGEIPGDIGTFDVAFSKMLAEHVESGPLEADEAPGNDAPENQDVPEIVQSDGMTLYAAPACICVTDKTNGWVGGTLRLTIDCSCCTSVVAMMIGSTDSCGIAACEPDARM